MERAAKIFILVILWISHGMYLFAMIRAVVNPAYRIAVNRHTGELETGAIVFFSLMTVAVFINLYVYTKNLIK